PGVRVAAVERDRAIEVRERLLGALLVEARLPPERERARVLGLELHGARGELLRARSKDERREEDEAARVVGRDGEAALEGLAGGGDRGLALAEEPAAALNVGRAGPRSGALRAG